MKKIATIETGRGIIKLELFADKVPNTVANFEKLANSKFYDGLEVSSCYRRFHDSLAVLKAPNGDLAILLRTSSIQSFVMTVRDSFYGKCRTEYERFSSSLLLTLLVLGLTIAIPFSARF